MKKISASKIILIVCLFAFIQIGCQPKSKNPDVPENGLNSNLVNNPQSASGNAADKKIPVFKFEKEEYDFGEIVQGEKVYYEFRFTNAGNEDLLIRAANGSCGCTVPEYPQEPIHPGANGVIKVTFNSEGKEGMQHKTVTLIANTMPNTKVLTITGEVNKK